MNSCLLKCCTLAVMILAFVPVIGVYTREENLCVQLKFPVILTVHKEVSMLNMSTS